MKKNCLICLKPFETGDANQKYCSLSCAMDSKNMRRRKGITQRLLYVLLEQHGTKLLMDSEQYKLLRVFNWFDVTEKVFPLGSKAYYIKLTKRGHYAARQFLNLE